MIGRASPRLVGAVLAGAALIVLMQLYCTIPLAPELSADLRVSASTASWATTTFGLAFAAGTLLFAGLSDGVGRVPVLRWGTLALVPATLLVAAAPSWPWLLAARGLQGVLAATVPPVALAYISEQIPARHRAGCLAAVSGSFLLAAIVGQDYGGILGPWLGWRWTILATLPVLVAAHLAVASLPEHRSDERSARVALRGTVELLRCRALARPCFAALGLLGSFTALSAALTHVASSRYGLDPAALSFVRTTSVASLAVAPLVVSRLRRVTPPRTGAIALLVAAAGALVLTASANVVALAVGHAIVLGAIAVAVPNVVAIVAAAGGSRRGAAVALYSFTVFLGASAGPVLATTLEPYGFAVLGFAVATWLTVSAFTLAVPSDLGPNRWAARRGGDACCG